MNPDLDRLHPYPFERLRALLAGLEPPAGLEPVVLSIGEPRHPVPGVVREALVAALDGLGRYPVTAGAPELRAAIAEWCTRRFALPPGRLDPERHVLPVSGSREALFAFVQAAVDRHRGPLVVMPNPFYQIYEGAALLAGAEPHYLPCTRDNGYVPDFDAVPDAVWARCQILFVCTPGNPTGAVIDRATLARLIELAERHDFVIASDECYSELYLDEDRPPPGLLEAAAASGRDGFERCIVFNSLSKRSSVPGLRSGFVAGDARLIERFRLYRSYHGATLPPPNQAASVAAWRDEAHVVENRALYRAKFDAVRPVLGEVLDFDVPPAGFYLWPETPGDDREFARDLFAAQHVTVLPGQFLSRSAGDGDPGRGRVRIALVAPLDSCVAAARRIRDHLADS
ncbi:MAG: succinyldiaminopimelate transaminase [Gammaproteobacteria bacterium]|nr:succinyldiaminopimelate transaminase [Gammaproteobacteria bacterium]